MVGRPEVGSGAKPSMWLCTAKKAGGPGGQLLPVLASWQKKGLQGRECVYVTKEGNASLGRGWLVRRAWKWAFWQECQCLQGRGEHQFPGNRRETVGHVQRNEKARWGRGGVAAHFLFGRVS